MLEVIDKGPSRESDKAPLLFVHGAWHGAWGWDEHFLDFFAAKGYRSLAVSLRGHGKSPAPRPMSFVRSLTSLTMSCQLPTPCHTPNAGRPFAWRLRGAKLFGIARRAGRRVARSERNHQIFSAQVQAPPVVHSKQPRHDQDVARRWWYTRIGPRKLLLAVDSRC